ncbi:hypothetical protein QQX98_005906 [Neonectria punicea]|uniref:Uncharacterized protein n=1 Tax=Neonectria punicea TaxID=979145 RepID=A0ABR1H3B2_9HYPO
MLAHRLRNQSITRQSPGFTSSHHNPSAALSPASLPDDNEFLNSMAMDIDEEIDRTEDDTTEPTIPNRNQHRTSRKGLGITVPTPPSGLENGVIQPSPSATDPAAVIRAQAESSGPTLYGPEYDLVCPELEVDEGYCEEEDDFSWLESVVSLRDVSSLNSATPEGIKKRYGLRYRTSTEAATRCTNAVHSVPRMRRRDKKRRKSSRLPDMAAIVATTIAT